MSNQKYIIAFNNLEGPVVDRYSSAKSFLEAVTNYCAGFTTCSMFYDPLAPLFVSPTEVRINMRSKITSAK